MAFGGEIGADPDSVIKASNSSSSKLHVASRGAGERIRVRARGAEGLSCGLDLPDDEGIEVDSVKDVEKYGEVVDVRSSGVERGLSEGVGLDETRVDEVEVGIELDFEAARAELGFGAAVDIGFDRTSVSDRRRGNSGRRRRLQRCLSFTRWLWIGFWICLSKPPSQAAQKYFILHYFMVLCLMAFQLNRLWFKEDNAFAYLYVFQKDLVPQRSDAKFKLWYRTIFHSLDSCKSIAQLKTQHASRILWNWALVLFSILPNKTSQVRSIHAILPHVHQAECTSANVADGTNLYETWKTCKTSPFDSTDILWEASVWQGRVCEAGLKKLGSNMGTKLCKFSWRKGVGGRDP